MPKHGDVRKIVKHYVHEDKVIEKKEEFQTYYVWHDAGFFSSPEGYWKTMDTKHNVIEVKDLNKVKEHGVEYYG